MGKIYQELSPDARNMLASPVVSEWYSVEWIMELYTVIFEVLKEKNPLALVDYGRFSAEQSSTGLLKFLMKFIDMDNVIKRMKPFWKHYHKGGKITASDLIVEDDRKKRMISTSTAATQARQPALALEDTWPLLPKGRAPGMSLFQRKRAYTTETKSAPGMSTEMLDLKGI